MNHLIGKLMVSESSLKAVTDFMFSTESEKDILAWEKLFDSKKLYEASYNLWIAISLLSDQSEYCFEGGLVYTEERKVWRENFIVKGGFAWALEVIS